MIMFFTHQSMWYSPTTHPIPELQPFLYCSNATLFTPFTMEVEQWSNLKDSVFTDFNIRLASNHEMFASAYLYEEGPHMLITGKELKKRCSHLET